MKKKLKFLPALLFLLLKIETNAFALSAETDVSLYNKLCSAYNSGFYPGALQFAEQIEKETPDSFFLGDVLLIKGECLVRLNETENAEEILLESIRLNSKNQDKLASSYYWLGKYYESESANQKALSSYFESLKNRENKYFSSAVLNSANIYLKQKDYEKSIPLYEYVIENGQRFSANEYVSSILNLSKSYNANKNPEKTILLYSKFSSGDFENLGFGKNAYLLFTELCGEAYELSGNYKKAYELYCEVLESGEKNLAADALKKAYLISTNHRREVGSEPGEILDSAQKTFADNPDLLGEFWTRLATDAFSDGDFRKSLDYFDEAEKNVPVDLFLYALLYRAQIVAGKNPDEKTASQAEEMILQSRSILNAENENIWSRETYILLCRYAAIQKKWDKVKEYAQKVIPLDEDTRFFLSLAYYSTGDFQKSNNLLKNQNNELHALSLAHLGDLKNATFVYENIESERDLKDEERLNYAKVLLLSGRYKEAQIESAKCKIPEAKYILGLSQFNTWSWPYAEENFSSYVKNPGNKNQSYVSYALFYLGYSQYREGKTKEAFSNLSRFADSYPNHELFYNGCIAASNCAVQNLDYASAEKYAEKAVNESEKSGIESNKEESILLYAEILSEEKKFDEAEKTLSENTSRKDSFGMKSLFQLAQLYEKQNLYEKADSSYKEIYERFPQEKLSQEAMYRRGELYYNAELYENAVKCFDEYTKDFPFGSFIDSSRYYSSESLAKSGNSERAILQYQQLIQRFPESSYVYSSAKNLVSLYREKGDYKKALEYANFLLENYKTQAESDGIENQISNLKELDSGKSEEIVQKENEFQKAGGLDSLKGRKLGTELVKLYAKSSRYEDVALNLAENLFKIQKGNLEKEYPEAAENAEFIARKYREGEKNKEAAELYLNAAEYYRMGGQNENAARSLYGSYDAFRAAELSGDANETAKLLQSLYPESREARSVKVN